MAGGTSAQSPSHIAQALDGVEFPIDKQGLLEKAKENGADDSVLELLENLPERDFESMSDVTKAFGGVESGG